MSKSLYHLRIEAFTENKPWKDYATETFPSLLSERECFIFSDEDARRFAEEAYEAGFDAGWDSGYDSGVAEALGDGESQPGRQPARQQAVEVISAAIISLVLIGGIAAVSELFWR